VVIVLLVTNRLPAFLHQSSQFSGSLSLKYRPVSVPAVAARSKASVCGRSPVQIVGSNPAGGMYIVSGVCCKAEVSATG
jgi:hypothetical protein